MVLVYDIVLFLHVLAAIGIVSGSCFEHYFHSRMRRAENVGVLNEWIGATKAVSKMMPIFAITLLVCGVYMTVARWGWQQPWIAVSLVLLIAIGAAAPLVLDPHLKVVERAAATGESLATIAGHLAAPVPNIASGIFTAEAIAIVLLMVAKPALVPSLIIVIVAAVSGGLLAMPRAAARLAETAPVATEAERHG